MEHWEASGKGNQKRQRILDCDHPNFWLEHTNYVGKYLFPLCAALVGLKFKVSYFPTTKT